MIDATVLQDLPAGVAVHPHARLAHHTTFRLGGACPALLDCPDAGALAGSAAALFRAGADFLVIGQGSNLLVSDRGIGSIVLRYCAQPAPGIAAEGGRLRVPGNMLLDDLACAAMARGLGDLSFCSGIPGTVGGAIAGNAGAFGRQIGEAVESVRLMDRDGGLREAAGGELGFAYRHSLLKQTGAVVLDAVLRLAPCDRRAMEAERGRIMALRREKHPDWRSHPCAGSIFRNVEPTSAAGRRQAAGWFLEQAGAKAFRVGGARLFERHANIIVADPGAAAQDVFDLSEMMAAAVRDKFGLELAREITLLGEFRWKRSGSG